MSANVYSDVLRCVAEYDAQGMAVTATIVAKTLECDTDTARRYLANLESKRMLERRTEKSTYLFYFPGHEVEHPVLLKPGPKPRPPKAALTPAELALELKDVKPGYECGYCLERMEEYGNKYVIVERVTVAKRLKHLYQLSNGHCCLPIEMYWWVKRHQIIGTDLTETYRRIEKHENKKQHAH